QQGADDGPSAHLARQRNSNNLLHQQRSPSRRITERSANTVPTPATWEGCGKRRARETHCAICERPGTILCNASSIAADEIGSAWLNRKCWFAGHASLQGECTPIRHGLRALSPMPDRLAEFSDHRCNRRLVERRH